MSFSVKPHLPLITTRIEFNFNSLPPPPQITPRRELGAHIRRQGRRPSLPYSRPRHAREKTPARKRSESPLSELLSDSESSEDEGIEDAGQLKISKPVGEVGRSNSGGYNLQKALDWDEKRFNEFTKFVNDEVANKLEIDKCFSKQNSAARDSVIELVTAKFKIKNIYSDDWPVRDALKLRLKYTSEQAKKKVQKTTEANLKKVLRRTRSMAGEEF